MERGIRQIDCPLLLVYFAEVLEALTARITIIRVAPDDHCVAVRGIAEDYVRVRKIGTGFAFWL